MTGPLRRRLGHKTFKLVYLFYYRFLFGRRFPGAARLERRIREWERQTGRGDAPALREAWEWQYEHGNWEFMRALDELPRYSVIAGFLHRLRPGGSVLDVGGGAGILREHLLPLGFSRYLAVDLSEAAVRQGRERVARGEDDPRSSFVAADAEAFAPPGRFDAVVFNECVYYFEDPVGTVERYRGFVEPGGLLLVSMFRSRRSDVIHKKLGERLNRIEEIALVHRKGTWVVSLYQA
jgi:SAM-dependent methyltransferase